METLPTYAKVAEYQLGIVSPDDASRSVMNLKLKTAPSARELWVGQVAFAAMTHSDMRKLISWLQQMDGRQTSFLLPAPSDVLTHADTHTATLTTAVAAGDAVCSLSFSPASGTVKAGTLLTFGSSASDEYQVCEVVSEVAISEGIIYTDDTLFTDGYGYSDASGATVVISPRARWAFSAGATVVVGATSFRVRLADDEAAGSHGFELSHGVASISVVEAVHA